MCAGGARAAHGRRGPLRGAAQQFGQPIAAFGAIKHKLGEMTARLYAVESLVYRTAGLIDTALAAVAARRAGGGDGVRGVSPSRPRSAKVAGSEMLDFVLDENVQIHGGNGFVRDYTAERYYRDARVNRIFEGTNEINRLLIPGMLVEARAQGRSAAHRRREAAAGRDPGPAARRRGGDTGPLAPNGARWPRSRRWR